MAAITDKIDGSSAGQEKWAGHDPLHPGITLEDTGHHVPAPSPQEPQRVVVVGIAEMTVSDDHSVILTSEALGSCVCVAFYDPIVEVGGMLHAMLPESSIAPTLAANRPTMFLDTGLPLLLEAALEHEADKHRMLVYIAGGAQIMDESAYFNLGRRNHRVAADLIQDLGLRVRAQDVGGPNNRTLMLNLATGEVSIKIAGQPKEYRL